MPVVPAMWELATERIALLDQPEQKLHETFSQQKTWGWWCMLVISTTVGRINKRIIV
jgi:hypothetical protein